MEKMHGREVSVRVNTEEGKSRSNLVLFDNYENKLSVSGGLNY